MREAVDWKSPDFVMIKQEEEIPEKVFTGLCWSEVIRLGEWAIANPQKWETVKARIRNPEATCGELAGILGVARKTVNRHLDESRSLKIQWN